DIPESAAKLHSLPFADVVQWHVSLAYEEIAHISCCLTVTNEVKLGLSVRGMLEEVGDGELLIRGPIDQSRSVPSIRRSRTSAAGICRSGGRGRSFQHGQHRPSLVPGRSGLRACVVSSPCLSGLAESRSVS